MVVGKAERPPLSIGLTCLSPCIYRLQRPETETSKGFKKVGISG
jgi:hypothetical protein